MAKCRGELLSKDLELQRLRRDVTSKTSQISRLEESLHCMKNELDSKTNLGVSTSFCSFTLVFAENSLKSLNLFPFPHCRFQRWIWGRHSIAARPTDLTVPSGSRSWRGSSRPCVESWLTLWSSCKNSEMFYREHKPLQMSGRTQWKNSLSNLGEDVSSCEVFFCGLGQRTPPWWWQCLCAAAQIRKESAAIVWQTLRDTDCMFVRNVLLSRFPLSHFICVSLK